MNQDAISEGSPRNIEMSFKHDREWDYELEQIVEAIEERDAKCVDFRFPEGLKRHGPAVANDLRQFCNDDMTFMLSGQPCYGACDLDTYLMRRADVFVHFDHSPIKESDEIIYVPLLSNVNPFPIMEGAPDDIEGDEVGPVITAQHMSRFEDICDWLEECGYTVQIRKGDDCFTYEGQVLGCNYISTDTPVDDVPYVSGGKFHPLDLAMEHPNENVTITDPVNDVVTIVDTRKFMKQRYTSVHKAMDAEKWDIISCTKTGQGCMEIAEKVLEDNGNAYLVTMDKATPGRLRNFNMDAFVNTDCSYTTTGDGPRFHRPMLMSQERRITVGNEPLDVLEFDTFHGTW